MHGMPLRPFLEQGRSLSSLVGTAPPRCGVGHKPGRRAGPLGPRCHPPPKLPPAGREHTVP